MINGVEDGSVIGPILVDEARESTWVSGNDVFLIADSSSSPCRTVTDNRLSLQLLRV